MCRKHRGTARMTLPGIRKSRPHQACKFFFVNASKSERSNRYRYILSWVINLVLGDCSTFFLRALNVGAICIVFLVAYDILRTLNRRHSIYDVHSALNISLFPPLFFFSSLYYTDVISTLFVLVTYNLFLKFNEKGSGALWAGFILVPCGVLALCFRQTNIFWVAVFPAGLALVNALKPLQLSYEGKLDTFVTKEDEERWRCLVPECHKYFNSYQFWRKHVEKHAELTKWLKSDDVISVIQKSWSGGYVYDCFVQNASLEGIYPSHQTGPRTRVELIISRLPFVHNLYCFGDFLQAVPSGSSYCPLYRSLGTLRWICGLEWRRRTR
jgi:hypothetical protein